MKIFLLFAFVVQMTLYSTPINIKQSYKEGIESYKNNNFTTSYKHFKKIYLHKLADQNFNFYFGKSAYETGNYENALAAFERVEMSDPHNIINKIEMARTFFMLKMYKDAEMAYREVLENPNLPNNIRANIELALAKVSRVQRKSFTYATVITDILYDSNINYASLNDYTFEGTNLQKTEPTSDTAFQLFADIINIYDIGYKNGFALKNTFSVYFKNYTDTQNNKFNIQFFGYTPSLLYKETSFTIELPIGIDILEIGNRKYLSSIFFSPQFQYNHSNTLRSIAHIKYQKKVFAQQAQFDLDANHLEFGYGLQSILTPRSYLQTNIKIISEDKVRGNNEYVDYDEYKINTRYANQFTSKYSFELYGQLSSTQYKDFSSGFNSTREDITGNGSISFTMLIVPQLRFKLSTTYEYANSNQDRFSYKKHTATAGLVKTF